MAPTTPAVLSAAELRAPEAGPAAWPGGARIHDTEYAFVRHGGRGRRWSGYHVRPSASGTTLCGRTSPHGWEPAKVPPPSTAGDGRWCWRCSDRLLDLIDVLDELSAYRWEQQREREQLRKTLDWCRRMGIAPIRFWGTRSDGACCCPLGPLCKTPGEHAVEGGDDVA